MREVVWGALGRDVCVIIVLDECSELVITTVQTPLIRDVGHKRCR